MNANRPMHFEILAKDPEKVAAFYTDVFGWKIEKWNGPMDYWMVNTGPMDAPGISGGITTRVQPQPVINTVTVDSIDEALKKVAAAGGKKVSGPDEIPGVGLFAYCADVEGILFGILQPKMPM
jgi:uncharacterized protein